MPTEQLEIFRPTASADAFSGEVNQLIGFLRGKGWVRRKLIEQFLEWDERFIRDVAHASSGQIIAGNLGYKLLIEATPEEFQRSRGRLKGQSDAMLQRIVEMDRAWHGFGHT